MKKWSIALLGVIFSLSSFAQQAGSESIEMADAMRTSGKIYVVVLVVSVILFGLILYLIKLDRKISRMESEISLKNNT